MVRNGIIGGLRAYALKQRPDFDALEGFKRLDALLTAFWVVLGNALALVVTTYLLLAILILVISKLSIGLASEIGRVGYRNTFFVTLLFAAVVGLLWRGRHRIRLEGLIFAKRLLKLLYYSLAVTFYMSCIPTGISIILICSNVLVSFLTSPIGFKADFVYQGFGTYSIYLAGISVALYLTLLVMRKTKPLWETEPTSAGSQKPLNHA